MTLDDNDNGSDEAQKRKQQRIHNVIDDDKDDVKMRMMNFIHMMEYDGTSYIIQ